MSDRPRGILSLLFDLVVGILWLPLRVLAGDLFRDEKGDLA